MAQHGHCLSSVDSYKIPPSFSFYSSFLGLPLAFFPGVMRVFWVLTASLFLLPCVLPQGLLGVGTLLGFF